MSNTIKRMQASASGTKDLQAGVPNWRSVRRNARRYRDASRGYAMVGDHFILVESMKQMKTLRRELGLHVGNR